MLLVTLLLSATTAAAADIDPPFFCGKQANGITTPGAVSALYLDLRCSLPGK